MAADDTLILELEQAIQRGSAAKRGIMAERVTELFVDLAERSDTQQVALFDAVLGRLIDRIETPTRAGISRRLAPVESAPAAVVRRLARDDDIDVAGPVLRESPRLGDADLLAIARRMGPAHLLAIAQRCAIAEPVGDTLVERGNQLVLQAVAANSRARLSDLGFGTLVTRAAGNGELAEVVGRRPDIPAAHLRRLIAETPEIVQRRLSEPQPQGEVGKALAQISAAMSARPESSYREAQRTVLALVRSEKLNKAALAGFARNGQFGETLASLSALARLPIHPVEQIMRGERLDALLILARAIGIEWATAKAIIALRGGRATGQIIDEAKANFDRLPRQGAERVVRFWRDRARRNVRPA